MKGGNYPKLQVLLASLHGMMRNIQYAGVPKDASLAKKIVNV
jgi:hypothetical protein